MVLEQSLVLARIVYQVQTVILVQEVNISDKSYVKVSAINYDANYYSDDLETIPES